MAIKKNDIFKLAVPAGFFALLFFSGSVSFAHAADACALTKDDLISIQAVQSDSTLSYHDEVTQEAALRKSLLSKTILCAMADAEALKTQLGAATTTDSDSQAIQSQIEGQFDDTLSYYQLQLLKTNSAGIAGTQALASDLLGWRKGTYLPLVGQANNFMLWSHNQSLFATAAGRFGQIQKIVSFLAPAGDSSLASAFASAQTSFNVAQDQNGAAEAAMLKSAPADESLPLIQQSLKSLAATYQQFFVVSGIIQGINSGSKK